ncbi:MAG: hypothetical protein K1W38_10350 [Lachnospiraceae bacterium]
MVRHLDDYPEMKKTFQAILFQEANFHIIQETGVKEITIDGKRIAEAVV